MLHAVSTKLVYEVTAEREIFEFLLGLAGTTIRAGIVFFFFSLFSPPRIIP